MNRCCAMITALSLFFSQSVWAQEDGDGPPRQGNPTREFIASCTYGVLAGTIVGAASLAFVDKPSDKLNRVARGASLGLYTGILLGLYVLYIVPGMEAEPEETEDPVVKADRLPLRLSLLFDDRDRAEGIQADWVAFRF
jgi:hypothetical protein